MKEIIDKLNFYYNLKLLFCERQCQETEKTNHKQKIFAKETLIKTLQNMQRTLKTQE